MNAVSKLELEKRNVAVLYCTLLQHAQNRGVLCMECFVWSVLFVVNKLGDFTNWRAVMHYTKSIHLFFPLQVTLSTYWGSISKMREYFLRSPSFRRRILIPCGFAFFFVLLWICANIWHDIPRFRRIWFWKGIACRHSSLVLQLLLCCLSRFCCIKFYQLTQVLAKVVWSWVLYLFADDLKTLSVAYSVLLASNSRMDRTEVQESWAPSRCDE